MSRWRISTPANGMVCILNETDINYLHLETTRALVIYLVLHSFPFFQFFLNFSSFYHYGGLSWTTVALHKYIKYFLVSMCFLYDLCVSEITFLNSELQHKLHTI